MNLSKNKETMENQFRAFLVIKNESTVKKFKRSAIKTLNCEELRINKIISKYNNFLSDLLSCENKCSYKILLKEVEKLDAEIDLMIHVMNKDFSDLTKIHNKTA